MKIFLTSTLKSDYNLRLNQELCRALEARGFEVYLPQRDTNQTGSPEEKFSQNLAGIRAADTIIAVLANPSRNLTAEIGYAYALGKPIIGLKNYTDEVDLMISGMFRYTLESDELSNETNIVNELAYKIKTLHI